MNKITVWKKFNIKSGQFEHNHIEDGYCPNNSPTPFSDLQKKGWVNLKWKGKLGLLIQNKVVLWMKD